MEYREVQPRAVDIKKTVLSRRMPPWGAVKGFGDFRNDQGLSQTELELITDWVDSDTPKGNNPNVLPKKPTFDITDSFKLPLNGISISNEFIVYRELNLDGLFPVKISTGDSARIVASLPDGEIKPLLWLYEYRDGYQHPFLFRKPIILPRGTVIRGLPRDTTIVLLPIKKTKVLNRTAP